MMKRIYLAVAAAPPWLVLTVIVALSLSSAVQLPKLTLNVSPDLLSLRGDPDRRFYEQAVAVFGSEQVTVLFIRDPNLFEPSRLAAIEEAIERIEALPQVLYTQSLFSLPNLRTRDEFVYTDPFLEPIPQSAAAAGEVIDAARRNPFVRNNLLSADANAMAINVFIDGSTERSPDFDRELVSGLEAALAPLAEHVAESFQLGMPYVRHLIEEQVRRDAQIIIPLAMAVLFLALITTLRRPNAALIPFITSGLSILWTLGFMAAFNLELNVITAIVPALLIIIGSTEDIHLIAEYYEGISRSLPRGASVRRMARYMGLAVSLTFFTTYVGFLSVAVNPIEVLRDFGLVASTGLLLNFLATVALVPLYLRYLGDRNVSAARGALTIFRDRIGGGIYSFVGSRKRIMATLTASFTLVMAGGIFFLDVNNNILAYFAPQSPIQERASVLHEELSGMQSFSIVLDGEIEGTFKKVRYLRDLEELRRYLEADERYDFSVGFSDYLALLNSAVNESGKPELPYSDEIVEELTLFVRHRDIREYISPDFSMASVVVRHNIGESRELRRALAALRAFAAANIDPALDVQITGESILSSNAADRMAAGQAQSLAIVVTVIFAVIALLFFNPKVGLIALLPNVFPIVILFGVMGYLDIPLDTGTAMIAAISIGICVDNTMHFMVRYSRELRRHRSESGAIEATLRTEATPITSTSIAMMLGLGVMVFSSFPPVVRFGALSAMVMFLAWYADFVITPIAMSRTRLLTLWDLLSLKIRRHLTGQSALFRDMVNREVRRAVVHGAVQHFHADEIVMRRGEPCKDMYVVLAGKVEIRGQGPANPHESVQVLGPGGVFGVVALVCDRPRIATATALGESIVLRLDWGRIRSLARIHPRTASKLFRNLAVIIAERFAEQAGAEPPGDPARTDPCSLMESVASQRKAG
jgi:predicted RND superfamily exporter protein